MPEFRAARPGTRIALAHLPLVSLATNAKPLSLVASQVLPTAQSPSVPHAILMLSPGCTIGSDR